MRRRISVQLNRALRNGAILMALCGVQQTLIAQATAIRPSVDTMTVWQVRGRDTVVAGRLIDDISIRTDSAGVARIFRIYTTESLLLGHRVDTLVDRVDGLQPDRVVTVFGDSAYQLDFTPQHLRGSLRLASGLRQPVEMALPPGAINGSSFDLFVRGSLLRIDDSVHAVGFTPTIVGGIARLSMKVAGQEEIAGRRAWRVTGVFPPGVRTTFWIDQETRAMLQQQLELPGGVVILIDHRIPTPKVPPRRVA